MHVVEKTTVVLTSVHRVHRVLKFTMDFVPCKLHETRQDFSLRNGLSSVWTTFRSWSIRAAFLLITDCSTIFKRLEL